MLRVGFKKLTCGCWRGDTSWFQTSLTIPKWRRRCRLETKKHVRNLRRSLEVLTSASQLHPLPAAQIKPSNLFIINKSSSSSSPCSSGPLMDFLLFIATHWPWIIRADDFYPASCLGGRCVTWRVSGHKNVKKLLMELQFLKGLTCQKHFELLVVELHLFLGDQAALGALPHRIDETHAGQRHLLTAALITETPAAPPTVVLQEEHTTVSFTGSLFELNYS